MQPTRMGDKLEKSSSKFSRSGLAPCQSSPVLPFTQRF